MSDTLLSSTDVAERVGCDSRGGCAIIRHLNRELGRAYPEQLRVSSGELEQWLAQVATMRACRVRRYHKESTYFISRGKFVKIGWSHDVDKRLATLQKANPEPLSLRAVFPGGAATEAYFHGKYRELKVHGEWFRLSVGAIERLKKGVQAQ
jgi:hypothetical protein